MRKEPKIRDHCPTQINQRDLLPDQVPVDSVHNQLMSYHRRHCGPNQVGLYALRVLTPRFEAILFPLQLLHDGFPRCVCASKSASLHMGASRCVSDAQLRPHTEGKGSAFRTSFDSTVHAQSGRIQYTSVQLPCGHFTAKSASYITIPASRSFTYGFTAPFCLKSDGSTVINDLVDEQQTVHWRHCSVASLRPLHHIRAANARHTPHTRYTQNTSTAIHTHIHSCARWLCHCNLPATSR